MRNPWVGAITLVAVCFVAASCASIGGDEGGLAETETGTGAAVGGAEGGSADNASAGAEAAGGGAVAETSDEGATSASTVSPAIDDGSLDAKQLEAETISGLPDAEPAPNADAADTAPLVFDQPNDGAIEATFGVDRWTFDGDAGVLFAIDILSIDHDCRQDLTMVLESPSGDRGEVGWVGNGGCRVHGPFELEETGTHVVELHGGDGSVIEDTTGAYRLVPLVLTERDVAAATFDVPVDGEIVELLGVDRWTFDASEGQLLVIDVLAIDHDCRQDIYMTLEDPFGEREQIDWVGNGGCKAHEPIEIRRDGAHVLEFHGGDGSVIEEETGSYRFVLSFLTENDEVAGTPDTRLDGEITQAFGADRWTFDASEGQRLTIEILSIDHDCRQDLYLIVEDPFGEREEVAWIGNGGCKAYEPIALARAGTHVLEFRGGAGSVIAENLGRYSFTFSVS